jgi:formylglycine-generating enzyme
MALVELEGASACIDRFEAALVVVGANGTTTPWTFSRSVDRVDRVLRAVPAKGMKPQVNVSEIQASAACRAGGKRLCSFSEWTAACRGPENNVYPYGSTYRFGICNAGRPSPVGDVRRANGRKRLTLRDPRIAEHENTIMPGGSHPLCITAAGVYDLHGNVHEWIADTPKPETPHIGTFMGGFFADARINGEGCAYKTTAHSKEYHDYSTGFRCCKDADVADATSPSR